MLNRNRRHENAQRQLGPQLRLEGGAGSLSPLGRYVRLDKTHYTRALGCLCAATLAASCDAARAGSETTQPLKAAERASAAPSASSSAAAPREDSARERTSPMPSAQSSTSALFNAAFQRVEVDWQQVLFL